MLILLFVFYLFRFSFFIVRYFVFLYLFWVLLVPLFFFIGIWGSKSRKYLLELSSFYIRFRLFFNVFRLILLYSHVVLLIFLFYVISNAFRKRFFVFILLMLGFAIKCRCFHFMDVARSTCWSNNGRFCYFSCLILKMALMVFVVFCFFMLSVSKIYAPILSLFIIIVYFIVCFYVLDMWFKKSIAYMSIAHMISV